MARKVTKKKKIPLGKKIKKTLKSSKVKLKQRLKVKPKRKPTSKPADTPFASWFPSILAQTGRSRPRVHSSKVQTSYFTLGVAAFGFSLLTLGYLGYKNMNHDNPREFLSLTQSPPASGLIPRTNPVVSEPIAQQEMPSHMEPLAGEFAKIKDFRLEDKIGYWSEFIENEDTRRKVEDLVAGRAVDDTAPLIPDRYDCTTFVETVMALSRSASPGDFYRNLIAIRYRDSEIGFASRNHFPELDWIPNNQRAKILTDVTIRVATAANIATRVEKKRINRGGWIQAEMKRNQDRRLASVANSGGSMWMEAQVHYIELSKLPKVLKEIPNGAVINLVHRDHQAHPVLISHQGLAIREGNQVFFRHATRGGKIRTVELLSYLRELSKPGRAQRAWPLIGINVIQVSDSKSANSLRTAAM